ncbi:DALR anticodon-binding domain-containing protein [Sphaerisporangium perillae]|uniref:DALR anticodon-binding domain-containing protein n=1 Tax=Sphaerisporangium perillae TaxID=2935860 RepID=UPI00200C0071|nr:DALR anticodon-binding domain-containing protein [Sphaerisporangium perillae]
MSPVVVRHAEGVIVERLRAILGSSPVPQGSWEREAAYVSTAALRRAGARAREVAEELAVRLRAEPGVRAVHVRPNGFLVIEVAEPGEIVREILAEPARPAPALRDRAEASWPDAPRTWDNPGFVVRYAYVRAGAVERWCRDLGMDVQIFRPGLLGDPRDRAVLRVLAEAPSRREGQDAGRVAYLERLAGVYHDAFEHVPAIPKGDEAPTGAHAARVWMARAVRKVLGEGLTELGETPSEKI